MKIVSKPVPVVLIYTYHPSANHQANLLQIDIFYPSRDVSATQVSCFPAV